MLTISDPGDFRTLFTRLDGGQARDSSPSSDIRSLTRQVQSSPDDANLRWKQGEAAISADDSAGAVAAWRKALVLQTDHPESALRIADAAHQAGDIGEASRWLKRILNRRPDDDGLRIAILGLCLYWNDDRAARGFAETFVEKPDRSLRLDSALFHLFRLFGDEVRARRAAQLDDPAPVGGFDRAVLAANCATWIADRGAAARHWRRATELAPGGWSFAHRAIAEHAAGEKATATRTLASAAQMFVGEPEPLSDLVSALSGPGREGLRAIVLSTLARMASRDPAARTALGLTFYRIGDWRAAAPLLNEESEATASEPVEVARRNLAHLERRNGSLPSSAASWAFENGEAVLPGPSPASGETTVLILGPEDVPDQALPLLQAAARGDRLAVLDARDSTPPTDKAAQDDAAFLQGLRAGLPWTSPSGAAKTSEDSSLGYLPPADAARVQALGETLRALGTRRAIMVGASIAVPGALAAAAAGAERIELYLAEPWRDHGQATATWFEAGLRHVLKDRRCRAVMTDKQTTAELERDLDTARAPRVLVPGMDVNAFRQTSGGIHRVRAAEAIGADKETRAIGILAENLSDPNVKTACKALREAGRRPILWRWTGAQPDAIAAGPSPEPALAWPDAPAGHLRSVPLALIVGKADTLGLPILSHAAMSVALIPVSGCSLPRLVLGPEPMPMLPSADVDGLASDVTAWLDDGSRREATAEAARLWVKAHHSLGATRRFLAPPAG